jgi:hypothetical protein
MLIYLVYIGECTLYFLANVLPEIQNANLLLQREYTTGVHLHGIISNLLCKLKNRLNDEFFGCKVAQLIEDYPVKEIEGLNSSFKCFIRTVIEYIEKYYNKYKLFYKSISIFGELEIEKIEWKHVQQCCTFVVDQTIDQDDLYNDFNHIKSKYLDLKNKFGGIANQIESFIVSNLGSLKYDEQSINHAIELYNDCGVTDNIDLDEEEDDDFDENQRDIHIYKHKKSTNNIRSDHLWAFLLNGEDVPNLRKLIEFVFAIPASNAYCESIFSCMKYLWNNNRNRMTFELVGAELKIQMNTNLTCKAFYEYLLTKPDLLKKIRSSDKYSHVAKIRRIA